jgi:hypothetical protein
MAAILDSRSREPPTIQGKFEDACAILLCDSLPVRSPAFQYSFTPNCHLRTSPQ